MNWRTYARLQKICAKLPGGRLAYTLAQRQWGGLRGFKIDHRVANALKFMEAFEQVGQELHGRTAVEIGTGWAPILPIVFWLFGLERCFTYDICHLLQSDFVVQTVQQLHAMTQTEGNPVCNQEYKMNACNPRRLELLARMMMDRPKQILKTCQIAYNDSLEPNHIPMLDESADIVFSNLVLGNIPRIDLHGLLAEANRVLRKDGCMIHLIDLGDQFSHHDITISAVNFLQFSEEEFVTYNSAILYQNRLRAPAYREIFLDHGFEIIGWDPGVNHKAMLALPGLVIDPSFLCFQPEELCTTSLMAITRKL